MMAKNEKARIQTASIVSIAVGMLFLAGGCTSASGTAGFKAEKKPSKEEINRQIDEVKANANMPPHIKETALKKLQDDLAKAK